MPSLGSLQLGRAFRLFLSTLPIALVRLGAYPAFWLVTIAYLTIAGGLAWLAGQAISWLGVVLFLAALGGPGPLYELVQRYVLYVIKAAQIVVLSELLVDDALPAGASQLAWGKERVQERFGEVSAMSVVDELGSAVVNAFTGLANRVASWLPGDSFRALAKVLGRIIHFARSYIDETILACIFWLNGGSVWATARDGVVLYGMAWKPLLANAVLLMVFSRIRALAAFILFSAPIALVARLIAPYQRETAELGPDAGVTSRLEQVSDQFRELQQHAISETGGTRGQTKELAPTSDEEAPEA